MNLRSILVVANVGPQASAVIRGAATLAAQHDAHLVGLHVIDVPPLPGYIGGDIPPQVFEIQRTRLISEAKEVEAVFNNVLAEFQVHSEWRIAEGQTRSVVDLHARHSDLVCVGAPEPEATGFAAQTLGEELIFSAGRAVLTIPLDFSATTIGEYVAVAWNASREAARALGDAMSILSRARKVCAATVADDDMSDTQSSIVTADISHYLARHDVEVEAQTVHPGDVPTGKALHDWAHVQGADLIVMGAYGHTRLREVMLGGTTHWMLRHSTIPVLMSH